MACGALTQAPCFLWGPAEPQTMTARKTNAQGGKRPVWGRVPQLSTREQTPGLGPQLCLPEDGGTKPAGRSLMPLVTWRAALGWLGDRPLTPSGVGHPEAGKT